MPNSQFDRYSLIDSSSAIAVSGSTVGLEGLQAKKPAVSYSASPWSHHPDFKKFSTRLTIRSQVYVAMHGHDEIADDLYQHSLKFGFFYATYKGIDFEYYYAKSKLYGDFMGLDLFTENFVA